MPSLKAAAVPDYSEAYERGRLALLDQVIPFGRGLAVDLGCNDGTTTELLRSHGYEAVGVDLDPAAVAKAKARRPSLNVRVGSALDTDDLQGRDLTLCLELLEHFAPADQRQLVESIARNTRPGGFLVLSTPGRYSLYSLYERVRKGPRAWSSYDWWDPTHAAVVSGRRLRRLLTDAAFEVLSLTGYHYLPLRLSPPIARRDRLLAPMGFDLVVVARRAV